MFVRQINILLENLCFSGRLIFFWKKLMFVWQVRPSNPVSRATSKAARLWGSQEVFSPFTLSHFHTFTFSPPGPYHPPPYLPCWGLWTTRSPSLTPSSSPDSPRLTKISPPPTTSLHLLNKKKLPRETKLPLLHCEDFLARSLEK